MYTFNQNPHIRVIAVTGAKGGVGKSVCCVNLALALAQMEQRVLLFDANCALGNVEMLLGLSHQKNIADVLNGISTLQEIVVSGPSHLKIVPADTGNRRLVNLGITESVGIIHAFSDLSEQTDCLFIDTDSGLGDSVIQFSKAAQEIIVVVDNEPTAMADAAAFIHSMSQEKGQYRFHILSNKVSDQSEGRRVFSKMAKLTENMPGFSLSYLGAIPFDEHIKKSVRKRSPLLIEFPNCAAALAFNELAKTIYEWNFPMYANGNIEFFAEQMMVSRI